MSAKIVIVGAGPAGATCALALARAGVASVLLDDNPQAGGQIFRSRDASAPLIGADARGETLRRELQRQASLIDHRPGHEVLALYPGLRLWAAGPEGAYELIPEHLVLATGAVEVNVPVRGWTLPGVYTLGGLQILAKSTGTVPAGRTVLAGAGPLLYLVAAQLVAAGVNIVAVIDAADFPSPRQIAGMARVPALLLRGMGFELRLRRHGVRILRRHAVVEIRGKSSVEDVVAAPLAGDWTPARDVRTWFKADVVGLSFGLRANTELTQLAGCDHVYDAARGGWRVERGEAYTTSISNLHAIGDGAGIGGVDTAIAEGKILGHALARRLGVAAGLLDAEATEARRRLPRLQAFREALHDWSGLRPGIFTIADSGTMVCRCEDVTAGDLDAALDRGLTLPRGLKLGTRAGMGLCQGRTCHSAVQARIARHSGVSAAEVPMPTVRVPLRPVAVTTLATLAPKIPAG